MDWADTKEQGAKRVRRRQRRSESERDSNTRDCSRGSQHRCSEIVRCRTKGQPNAQLTSPKSHSRRHDTEQTDGGQDYGRAGEESEQQRVHPRLCERGTDICLERCGSCDRDTRRNVTDRASEH